mgnify:CR=1 FL=1
MIEREYLDLFSQDGELDVHVKFKDWSGTIASRRMNPTDLIKLISPEDGQILSKMTFDNASFEVYKYQIDPLRKILTIYARRHII